MKMIHCADLHLDAKMTANLDKEHAKERKAELLGTFSRMVAYAEKEGVEAILIAGDLFDTSNISATARHVVLDEITGHPQIAFYYLKGNHDSDNFLSGLEEVPDNLKFFGESWISYVLDKSGNIVLVGAELSDRNNGSLYPSLVLDAGRFNIVTLHGQESETGAKDKAEIIHLRALKNKGIDYLALGHIHTYKEERLDGRGVYCYPGCLEGRGFDECGEHGFVLLDIDPITKSCRREFVPFAKRNLYTVEVDVTDAMTSAQIREKIRSRLAEESYDSGSLLKILLLGTLDVECEKNVEYLKKEFEGDFYFVKIYDETTLSVHFEDYRLDQSLKGEFVRTVEADESLSEADKMAIIRYGLQLIAGEELI